MFYRIWYWLEEIHPFFKLMFYIFIFIGMVVSAILYEYITIIPLLVFECIIFFIIFVYIVKGIVAICRSCKETKEYRISGIINKEDWE